MFGKLTRRAALCGGTASLIGAALPQHAHAGPPDFAGVTLRVGTYKGFDEVFLPLAGQAATPYKIDYHEFNSGQLIVEAMNAGALDYGAWSEIPSVFAAAAQARVKIVAVLKGDVNDQVVLIPKTSSITDIAGLKGKRVGYVRGTTSHYYLLRMLWAAGLQFSDIQAINLSPTDGAAAFRAGDLDAWAIYGYAIQFALAQGAARVLRTAQGILSGNYHIAASPEALADPKRRAAIADYLQRAGRGYNWLEANKTAWSQALSPVIKVPLPFVEAQFEHESQPERLVPVDDAAIASAQQVADTFVKAGLIAHPVDVKPYFDTRFAAAIAAV